MLELDMKTVECVAIAIMWRSHTENGRMADVLLTPLWGGPCVLMWRSHTENGRMAEVF